MDLSATERTRHRMTDRSDELRNWMVILQTYPLGSKDSNVPRLTMGHACEEPSALSRCVYSTTQHYLYSPCGFDASEVAIVPALVAMNMVVATLAAMTCFN